MNLINTSIILTASFFSIYALAAAVECGIVIKMLSRDARSRSMFTPLWEVTNVFLVFGFTALAMLFNNALTQLSHALIATLGVALVTMLVRSCLVLSVFYIRDEDKIGNFLTSVFAVTTFLVPLTFAAAGTYLLTGSLFYDTLLGCLLMAAALAGLAGLGLAVISRDKAQRQKLPAEIVLSVWLLLMGCVVPLSVTHSGSLLGQTSIFAISIISGLGLALLLLNTIGFKIIKFWHFSTIAFLAMPLMLAWANHPYLISGQLTAADAYGAQAYGRIVFIGLIVMLPLIVLGGWLFIKLLPSQKLPAKTKS